MDKVLTGYLEYVRPVEAEAREEFDPWVDGVGWKGLALVLSFNLFFPESEVPTFSITGEQDLLDCLTVLRLFMVKDWNSTVWRLVAESKLTILNARILV